MPRPPGIISRANYVVKSFNNPCDAPWVLYVETALPAFLQVAIALVCFDILDIIRFIFRPARLRSGRHLRRGKKGDKGRRKQGLGRKVANKLPALSALNNRQVTQGVKNLWVIDGIGQRLLWWWLVADVASAFLYNWTTLMQKTEECQMANGAGASLREGANTTIGAIQGWQAIGYADFKYQRGTAVALPFASTHGGGNWELVASAVATNLTTQATTITMRLVDPLSGNIVLSTGDTAVLPGLGSAGLVVTAAVNTSGAVVVECKVDFGFASLREGAMVQLGIPVEIPPPIKHTCKIPFVGNP